MEDDFRGCSPFPLGRSSECVTENILNIEHNNCKNTCETDACNTPKSLNAQPDQSTEAPDTTQKPDTETPATEEPGTETPGTEAPENSSSAVFLSLIFALLPLFYH